MHDGGPGGDAPGGEGAPRSKRSRSRSRRSARARQLAAEGGATGADAAGVGAAVVTFGPPAPGGEGAEGDGKPRRSRSRKRRRRGGEPADGETVDPAAPHPADGETAAGGDGQPRKRSGSKARRAKGGAAAEPSATGLVPASEHGDDGTLAGSLRAAILRHTTALVLSRARGYVRQHRVNELRITTGRIRARVRGAGRQHYRVDIRVPGHAGVEHVGKVRWSCNCIYAVEHRHSTCKHVVAVTLIAADRLEGSPTAVRRWLGHDVDDEAVSPARFDGLAERLLATFSTSPATVDDALARASALAPAPFGFALPAAPTPVAADSD